MQDLMSKAIFIVSHIVSIKISPRDNSTQHSDSFKFPSQVQLDFYGNIAWSLIQRVTLPLCIFHRFHSAVTLAEIWKTTYKPRLE